MKSIYGEFSKVESMDDGTLKVWGYASSEAKDAEGEIITASAMKAAIPDYMKFGAVREMHKASAAGTAIEIEVQDDGRTFFGAHIVDPIAIKKIQTNVYKGFSIGGGIPKDGRDPLNKSIVNKIKLTEISLVDRPCNPEAIFTMYKIDGDVDENIEKGESPVEENQDSEAKKPDSESGESTQPESKSEPEPTEPEQSEKLDKPSEEDDLEKARFSNKTKETLAYVHKVMKDCCDKLGSLGYDVEVSVKSDDIDNLSKADDLLKISNELSESLLKVKSLTDESELLKVEIDNLKKENQLLKDQPEPVKGSLKAVEKSADVTNMEKSEDTSNIPQEGTLARAEYEMKKVINAGGIRFA